MYRRPRESQRRKTYLSPGRTSRNKISAEKLALSPLSRVLTPGPFQSSTRHPPTSLRHTSNFVSTSRRHVVRGTRGPRGASSRAEFALSDALRSLALSHCSPFPRGMYARNQSVSSRRLVVNSERAPSSTLPPRPVITSFLARWFKFCVSFRMPLQELARYCSSDACATLLLVQSYG